MTDQSDTTLTVVRLRNGRYVPAREAERLQQENRKLWQRDHARGHRPTPDCPVCVRFGSAPDEERHDG